MQKKISRIIIAFLGASALALTTGLPAKSKSSPKDVTVKIMWQYVDLPEQMKIYHAKSEKEAPLWKTKTVSKLSDAPIGEEIKEGLLKLKSGENFRFVLVYHNATRENLYFFAAPHRVMPEEYSLGFKFKCLCVNHAFMATANDYWYRVVELRVSEHIIGDHLDITHTLVKVSKEDLENFSSHDAAPSM